MNRQQTPQSSDQGPVIRYMPLAAIVVLVVVGYLVLFQPGIGRLNQASAQINPVAIGEDVAEQLSETAGRTSLDEAGEQMAADEAEPEGDFEDIFEGSEDLSPVMISEPGDAESAETEVEEKRYAISDTNIGGTDFTDLTPEELRERLYLLPELRGSEVLVDTALPVLMRFQTMVRPPWPREQVDEIIDSGARRYSPFDVVGLGTGPGGGSRVTPYAMPPFPPIDEARGPQTRREIPSAEQVARASVLVGVLGEPGNFLAIVEGGGERRQLRVGDEVSAADYISFVVMEITPNEVVIQNSTRPGDIGRITFRASNEAISGITMAISYGP